jgi:apolipoprotein N-acyltransferase
MMLFLPALTGLLLIASYPRLNQGYLAWIAFIPLIAFIFRAKNSAGAFWGGFVAGAIELFFLLIWIPSVLRNYGGLPGILSWIAYGLMIIMLACYPGAACAVTKWLIEHGGQSFLFLFPVVWVLLEFAQTHMPFGGFPWLLAGYSQSEHLSLIQVADLTGVYGISFLIVCFGAAVFWIGLHRGRGLRAYWPLVSVVLTVAFCLVYGRVALRHWERFKPDCRAALLQANLSLDDGAQAVIEKLRHGYVQMAHALKDSSVDLFILPESPSPVTFQNDLRYRQSLEALARRCTIGLAFNNVRSGETGGVQQYFNSAYFIDKNGNLAGIYDKIHLVPFGEYTPGKNIFFFVKTITKDVGEFHPGNNPLVVGLGDHQVNALICFEAVFPDLVRRFVRGGSQLMINLTNDGWYGDSAAPYQHFAIARWRAIENRRYLLRAANTGISAVIEPTGKVQSATGILREAICEGRFSFESHQTFYTRNGDVLVFLCAIIACGSLGYVFVMKFRRMNKRTE